jgi:hypothetical protein
MFSLVIFDMRYACHIYICIYVCVYLCVYFIALCVEILYTLAYNTHDVRSKVCFMSLRNESTFWLRMGLFFIFSYLVRFSACGLK